MASNFPGKSNGDFKLMIGHDMAWSCDNHNEPIKMFCESHKLAVCLVCAFNDHQKPCTVRDIKAVIKQLQTELEAKVLEIEKSKERLRDCEAHIVSCRKINDEHLGTLRSEVETGCGRKLQEEPDKEMEEIRVINEEADEEIRLINEKREARLKKCRTAAQQRRQRLKYFKSNLLKDIKSISDKVQNVEDGFRKDVESKLHALEDSHDKIRKLLKENRDLVSNAHTVLSLTNQTLRVSPNPDELDKITSAVESVYFISGTVRGAFCGRIDSDMWKWDLVDTIDIPKTISFPELVGLASEHEITFTECCVQGKIYVANLESKETNFVMQADRHELIFSCVSLADRIVVCGKSMTGCCGSSLNTCISLYDRQWELVRDIAIARNTTGSDTCVYIDVGSDGMILAAERGQSNIYVINPADGRTTATVTMIDKEVYGGIQALSTGDIVVKTGPQEFTVISRSGVEKSVYANGKDVRFSVDQLTDSLYMTYGDHGDEERGVYSVDQKSSDGVLKARGVVEYAESDRFPVFGPSIMTPSGKLACFNGDRIFVYKKGFMF